MEELIRRMFECLRGMNPYWNAVVFREMDTQFPKPRPNPCRLRIRLFPAPARGILMDLYCQATETREAERVELWRNFVAEVTNNSPDWEKYSEEGDKRPRIIKRGPIPESDEEIQQYCQAFYSLFARFDAFLDEQH